MGHWGYQPEHNFCCNGNSAAMTTGSTNFAQAAIQARVDHPNSSFVVAIAQHSQDLFNENGSNNGDNNSSGGGGCGENTWYDFV